MSTILHNSVLSINTMEMNICHIGKHQLATIWMVLTVRFSHHTSPKIQHCICMTKICADCFHCHSKKKLSHATMYLVIVSHQAKKYLHLLKRIQTMNASVHMVHHAHHMECSMYQPVNMVSKKTLEKIF